MHTFLSNILNSVSCWAFVFEFLARLMMRWSFWKQILILYWCWLSRTLYKNIFFQNFKHLFGIWSFRVDPEKNKMLNNSLHTKAESISICEFTCVILSVVYSGQAKHGRFSHFPYLPRLKSFWVQKEQNENKDILIFKDRF